jgi:hypothetical protein
MDARRFNPSLIKYILILIALIVLLALIPSKVTYTAVERQIVEADSPPEAQNEPTRHENERAYIDWLIRRYGLEYNVSSEVMHRVIFCESSYNRLAVGDAGYSRGLVQIHSKYWPEITDSMAFNADFSVRFLAEKLSEGKGRLWTCWRKFN